MVENGGNVSAAMREAEYSPTIVNNPGKITEGPAWKSLMDTYIGDTDLAVKHKMLLNATKIEHMTFSSGPRTDKEKEKWIFIKQLEEDKRAEKEGRDAITIDCLSDEEIKDMLAEINCKVRRIVHRDISRDVYYWAMDNKAVKDALDMAYKLKGHYQDNKNPGLVVPIQVNVNNDRNAYSA